MRQPPFIQVTEIFTLWPTRPAMKNNNVKRKCRININDISSYYPAETETLQSGETRLFNTVIRLCGTGEKIYIMEYTVEIDNLIARKFDDFCS